MRTNLEGAGADLVLLHGWGMTADVWHEVAASLAQQFRVHSVELPAASSAPHALDAMVETIAAASPKRASVCGWSLGGQLALRWAMLNPTQVERLVLIAATPRFVRGTDWEHGMAPAVFDAFVESLSRDVDATLQRFIVLQAHGDTAARNVVRRLRECNAAGRRCDAAALAAGLQLLSNTDLRPDLPGIRQPVLVVHGEHDAVVPRGAAEYLQRTLPHAELEIIAGAAHAPFVAQPRAVAQRIAKFCHG
jgi:pimeloyl-[acyl-carrier protein] methyl ester esterase